LNTAESFNGLFVVDPRCWHHISREHMQRYLDEQCLLVAPRRERRRRTVAALDRVGGVRLYLKAPKTTEQGGESLVA
jgi:hypothetical protein